MAYSGTYKGIRFRSILELSVIRYFESEGYELGKDLLYEVCRISYGANRNREYIIDLTFPGERVHVEVKPSSRVDNRRNRMKRLAAQAWCQENGYTYLIVTEQELRQCGELLLLEQAAKVPGVELNERARRALRRKEAVAVRKKRKVK